VILYLIKGERLAIIDSGAFDTPESAIAPALAEQGLSLKDIDLILNTHGHADHAGGNSTLQAVSGAEVIISKDEIPAFATGGAEERASFFAPLREVFDPETFAALTRENDTYSGGRFRISRTVGDGDVIDLGAGVELKVVALPGHTPGMVGYLLEKEGLLFAGDAMMGRGSRVGGLPIIWDSQAYEASAARLLKMPLQALCLAHNYRSFELPSEAIRTGGAIRTFVEECVYISRELRTAAERAVKAEPQATQWRQGERMLEELPSRFEVGSLSDAMPSFWSALGIYSFIRKVRAEL
jgi:glyoxylase-like metal-dependent hydrolase (beta-lactamase superfamily II)